LNTSASSSAAMFAFVMRTFWVLMTFQPSRSLAVSMVSRSESTLRQPLMSIAKWPPRRSRMPLTVRPLQRVSEMILSASPRSGLPVMRCPPPSIVPEPTKPMLLSRSP
jgi:hypothetical protein